jgi:diguanylate cyclase (GGDEF)-like protein/PAS domain S-box-containing protein
MSSEDEIKAPPTETSATSSTKSSGDSEENAELISSQEIILGMKTILDKVGTFIFIKDIAGRYTYVNKRVQELFEKPYEEIIGQDDSHFFDLHRSDELMRNDRCVIEQGKTVEKEEKTIIKSTGEERIYWTVKKPVRNQQGEIIGMCGVSTDITKRKQEEIALYKLNKRLDFLLSSSPAIIYTCEAVPPYAARFISANLTKILGYTVKEFLSTPNFWLDHIHPKDRDLVLSNLHHLFVNGKHQHEYRFQHRNGDWIWMRDELHVMKDSDGNSIELIGYFIEITNLKKKEFALIESRNLLKTIVDTAPVSIFWKDRESRFLGCNQSFARDAGVISCEEIIGKNDYQLIWKEKAESYRDDDRQVINSGIPMLNYEEPQTTPDGKTTWLRTSKVPLCDDTLGTIGVLGIYQDITEQKQNEDNMRLAATIYKSSNEAIMVTDKNNQIMAINPAFTRITGYELSDIEGKNPRIFQSGRHSKSFYQQMWHDLLKKSYWQGEIWDRHKRGSIHAKWLNISTIRHSDGSIYCFVAQFSDITEKKQKDELILTQANYDQLTGLPNRNLFKDRLDKEIKKSQRNGLSMSLLFLDLDHFKAINDTLGHDKGDELLKEVALRLLSCVRETDTVARLGGDEFAIILPDIDNRFRIEAIAQQIIQELSKAFNLGNNKIDHYISTSLGIVVYPEDGTNLESLMKHVDQAMYAAKLGGRNRFNYFTRSMQLEAIEKMALTHDLRKAIANNELQIYYQPILALTNGRINKAEALLRWHHPHRGMISPDTFIPLAEESGLIVEIGELVFKKSIANIKQWHCQLGYIIQVSVNMSPIQFSSVKKNQWSDNLAQLGLPGNSINVEITEGLLLKDAPVIKERLLEFRNSGIEVSIDDFGTGFSSLSYLKKFDIDYLKIDKSFINHLIDNETDRALVEAIIVMARKLDIKTIAEGVETKEQQDLLLNFGCDYKQGFLYSPAISADDFFKLIQQQN